MSNLVIEYIICRQPNGVQVTVFLQILIYLRFRECGITTKVFPDILVLVPVNDWFKQFFPTVGTVNVARPEQHSFTIPKLIEAEQRMKTGTSEMSIIC